MTEQEKYVQLPEHIKGYAKMLLAQQLSPIPVAYEKGKWYRLITDGTTCAFGEPYHACIKVGKENKLAVVFCGGGVSIDDFTAAHPNSILRPDPVNFYADDVYIAADLVPPHGMGANCAQNPFRDWTMLFVPYATGDFHCGQNDYTLKDGTGRILRHRGYTNYKSLIGETKKYIADPDQLLVTGFSAGAFAAALLTDDIMDEFPNCTDVSCFPDSAQLLFGDWQNTARKFWNAPDAVCARLTGENITLDSLVALHKKRKNVKIFYACSVRDNMLSAYQHYVDFGEMTGATREDGELFEKRYAQMAETLMQSIEGIGLYVSDKPAEGDDGAKGLTQHCMNMSDMAFTYTQEGVSFMDWIWGCANGNMRRVGLSLLKKG